MRQSTAWLLDLGGERKAAIGERELLHLVPQPELFDVPLTPAHCTQVLRWQERLLPVWDLHVWLGDSSNYDEVKLVAIIGYQPHSAIQPAFGALLLSEAPERILVRDEQFCELPDGQLWPKIAASCFRHGEHAVPILDLAVMFSTVIDSTTAAERDEKESVADH